MRYEFTITIAASGKDATEAWNEAVTALAIDPGATPERSEYKILDDDDNEIEDAS